MTELPSDAAFLVGVMLLSKASGAVEGARTDAMALPEGLRTRITSQTRAVVISSLGQGGGVYSEFPEPISACLVLPWYDRDTLVHHLVLFAGHGTGSLEVWSPERATSSDGAPRLRLASGYFGELHEFFRVTTLTSFRGDEGLPGQAAARRDVVVFRDLARSTAFLRAEAAKSVGLKAGFAFPVHHPEGMDVATVLLGQADAQRCRIDTWDAESAGARARDVDRKSEVDPSQDLPAKLAELVSRSGAPSIIDRVPSAGRTGQTAFGWIAPGSASVPHVLTVVV